eukprot:CAMPEP_0182558804 /NCGR_PEP_ID=MMETSP1324-20130603/2163_1 /TAXON_ID=236786 /ORGANISM="Florenciella sp., Strain RCC1587" /LENGTH=362 /DNA_ID=CAMNT_0024770999 /DNA_START=11 /DNA_END=1096 /DNA_ORIENTATION=-
MASFEKLKLKRVQAVEAGEACLAFITEAKDLYIWHPSGDETDEDDGALTEEAPARVPSLARQVVDVAIGWDHICALTADCQVFTWGVGTFGQLGHGDKADRHEPCVVAELAATRVSTVACGWSYTACVTGDGEVFTWGAAASGQLGHHDKVRRTTPAKIESLGEFGPLKAVSCGENHTAVLSRAGHVVTWGCPFDGRLGRASDDRSDPAEVGAFREHGDAWGVPLQVSCGMHHTVVRTDNGCVLTWGNGSGGQLGLGDVEHRDEPCVVPLFGDEAPAVSVSGGSQHTACCTAHGDLYLWGVFLPGPVQTVVEPSLVVVAGGVAVQSVSCSDKNTLALSDGEAYHWWDKNETAERDPQEQGQG